MASEPVARRLAICARPQCLERVHELLTALWLDTPHVAAADRIAFETAVAEVAANIVEHAGAGAQVELDLVVAAHDDRMEACFRDTGRAADVDVASAEMPDDLAETGRGLPLARAAADVSYERAGAVNRWRVTRRLGS